MSDTFRSRVFWTIALIATQAVQGVAQEQFRVGPRDAAIEKQQTTLSKAWEMRLLFCPTEKANHALYRPVSTSQACLPAGAACFFHTDCCSSSCHDFVCQ